MLKMQAILMAHRMPSRHREATSGSSQSCSPTLNAASKGVHANYNTCTRIWCAFLKTGYFTIFDFSPFNIWLKYTWIVSEFSHTLNMGLTCSRCVALKNGAWAWLTASIRALAVFAICSISMLYSRRRCFSLATPGKRESQIFQWKAIFPAANVWPILHSGALSFYNLDREICAYSAWLTSAWLRTLCSPLLQSFCLQSHHIWQTNTLQVGPYYHWYHDSF